MIASDLPNRSTEAVRERLNTHLARYRSEGFDILTIFCDGEGAIAKLVTELNIAGVRVNIAGPGQHVHCLTACRSNWSSTLSFTVYPASTCYPAAMLPTELVRVKHLPDV